MQETANESSTSNAKKSSARPSSGRNSVSSPIITRNSSYGGRSPYSRRFSDFSTSDFNLSVDAPYPNYKLEKLAFKEQASSFWRLAKMNSPEWLYALIGSIGSIVCGSLSAFFAYVLSAVLSVYYNPKPFTTSQHQFMSHQTNASSSVVSDTITQPTATVPLPAGTAPQTADVPPLAPILPSIATLPVQHVKEIAPPAKRGRGRPKRTALVKSPAASISPVTSGIVQVDMQLQKGNKSGHLTSSVPDSVGHSVEVTGAGKLMQQSTTGVTANIPLATPLPNIPPNSLSTAIPPPTDIESLHQSNTEVSANTLPAIPLPSQSAATSVSVPIQAKGHGQKTQSGRELPRRRGKKQVMMSPPAPDGSVGPDVKVIEQLEDKLGSPSSGQGIPQNKHFFPIPCGHKQLRCLSREH